MVWNLRLCFFQISVLKEMHMKIPLTQAILTTCLMLASVCFFEKNLPADDLILIQNNGLVLSGDFDKRSTEAQLFLTKRKPQIVLQTRHSWNEFQSMTYRGKAISKTELLETIPALETAATKRNWEAEAVQFWFPVETLQTPAFPPIQFQSNQRWEEADSGRVAALNIEAYVANWDRDAELDGLVVHLFPVNSQGQIVPVDGQVEFRLIGQRYRELNWQGRNDRKQFPELEQWSRQIRKLDFGANGALIKLEFRRIRPEFRPELAQGALLTGSLGIAGQGRFDASAVDVVIRPPSRFRDEHYLRSNSRSRVHPRENFPRP